MDKIPLVVITGPTATGKTALAVSLCKHFDGEVVGADSMQIYKSMTIGTAAPAKEEMEGIPHHLISFLDPATSFSVADYVALASKTIEDIANRGKMPFLVGGTGLYISSLLGGIDFDCYEKDELLRDKITEEYEENPEEVFEKLAKVDSETASKLHLNNSRRIIRALEVFYSTGKPQSVWNKENRKETLYKPVVIALNFCLRSTLYDRINKRVDNMIDAGLQNEVYKLIEAGVPKNCTAMQAIGYKEIIAAGPKGLDEAINLIKQNSRRYAKRQLTWLRRDEKINWLYVDELSPNQLYEKAKQIIEG